jgi:Na+/melibiose symporter-like transporter
MMPNFDVLGSLVRNLHDSFEHLFYIMLPVTILLSVVMGFFKSGDPDFPDILKRAFVASLLLVSFPEVSNFILDVCDGIALKIDNMSGLETVIRMAQEKSQSYSVAKNVLLLKFDDIFIAILSFASFMLLYFARYITVALYYFFWVLLSALSPLMILAYVFPSTAGITRNLYRGLIEVACWKILWAVLSAMLTSLSFGNIYQTEGSYITLTIMNFVIGVALLFTPLLMRSLIGDGVQAAAQNLSTTAFLAAMAIPRRALKVREFSRDILNSKPSPKSFNQTHNSKPRR